ncbi:MAG: rane protein [Chthoniobacter sp.]|nr:rane protein [Chthoniobacter sp.]
MEDNALRLSAALAYYSIFSVAPLLIIAIGLAGWFFGADAVRGELDQQLRGMVGREAAQAVQSMVQSASKPSESLTATLMGLFILLVGASGVFGQLKDALNTIWEVKPRAGISLWPFLRERLLSFGIVLVIGFLLLVSLVLTALLSAFNRWIEVILRLPDWLWGGAGLLISLAVVTVLFALIFKVLPDANIDWHHVWIGALATGILFEIGKFLLGLYLGSESTASSYGAAASVVLLLLWIYYASCILLFGAEFTKVYAASIGPQPEPSELAEPVTTEARIQQGLEPHGALHQPPRESLPLVFGAFPLAGRAGGDELPSPPRHTSTAASLAAALGCGLAIGIVSRVVEDRVARDPRRQFRVGTRALGVAALLFFGRIMQRFLQGRRHPLPRGLLKLGRTLRHAFP